MLKIAYDPVYAHPLPEGHRFPMAKYELIPEQLLYEGTITAENIFSPAPLEEEVILQTHDASYWQRMKQLELTDREMRAISFPLSQTLVTRERIICRGTIDCALFALEYGASLNVAGGTHHAFAAKGEGFCLLNDFAIAANYLLRHKKVNRILVVDLDVHQGNGTASIFSSSAQVFTFSMHGRHNYPFHKEKSDLDVPLEDGTEGAGYLDLLREHIRVAMEKSRPEIVFYLSGVDVLFSDKFGKLKLTLEDCRQRDDIVYRTCFEKGLPVAAAMGGGYSTVLKHIVEAHCNTFRVAKAVYNL